MGSEWKTLEIGEIVKTNYSTYSPKENWPFINYLDTGNITENKITEIQYLVAGKDKIPSRARRKVEHGDIVYSTVRPNQRHHGIIRNPPDHLLVSTGFTTIRANEAIAHTNFVYWYLSQPSVTEFLQTIGEHTASTYPSIKPIDIERLEIPLPPLPEQNAIAYILGSLDDKIELNRRMNETLEGMAQALFKSWFVDFDPVIDNALEAGNPIPEEFSERAEIRRIALANGTANREAAKPFPAAFQETEEMGWIPEGWEVKALSQAIFINPSVKLSKGTVAPFADMKALPTSGYSIEGVVDKAYFGGSKFQNGDVLLARITPCLENGKTGVVDFLSDSRPVGFGSTEFIVLRGKGELCLPYVACLAREENFRLNCKQSMVGSSGRQRVQNACFDSYFLATPGGGEVLKEFSSITLPIFEKSSKHAKENATLTSLRDTLLPKLISGELRIKDAEKMVEGAMG
jgi:type I restriction enzyme, S subunit